MLREDQTLRKSPDNQARAGYEWLLLVHQLPPNPSNLRVRTWRKLQRLGSVAIRSSVYVLPYTDKTYEDFQWLKQEIESAGGEATVLRAAAVEGATDDEIVALFRKRRDEEYMRVAEELDGLSGRVQEQRLNGPLSAGQISEHEAELGRLRRELERVITVDFFDAPGRSNAQAAYRRFCEALKASRARVSKATRVRRAADMACDPALYQGRLWVTRRNLFVDRLAAIWLIRRFIDPKARFSFVSEGEAAEGGIGFDMYGGEFTHRGEDCTVETMIKDFGLNQDAGLRAVAEIVHDIDLKDNKFNRSEASGLAAVLNGLVDSLKDDRKLVRHCGPIFDGLYELMRRGVKKGGRGENRSKVGTRAGRRGKPAR